MIAPQHSQWSVSHFSNLPVEICLIIHKMLPFLFSLVTLEAGIKNMPSVLATAAHITKNMPSVLVEKIC